MKVEVFCDGACSGNPGIGGYGSILRCGTSVKELSGAEGATPEKMACTNCFHCCGLRMAT